MKIALPVYEKRIAPRAEITAHWMIFCLEQREIRGKENMDLSSYLPVDFPRVLAARGVRFVVMAGCDPTILPLFPLSHIQVISGVRGEVSEIVRILRTDCSQLPLSYGRRRRGCLGKPLKTKGGNKICLEEMVRDPLVGDP